MAATQVDTAGDDPAERLLTNALLALEQRGEEGLQEFLTTHASHADSIRAGLEQLRRAGVLAPPPAAPAEARQFGEFRVVRRLASGGMGVVYLAEQTSLQRQVALKVVRPELLLSELARERFQREVEAVARLNHPGIVPILAVGSENGQPWFAMEYIEGRSLEELIVAVQGKSTARHSGSVLRSAFGHDPTKGSGAAGAFSGSYWEACVRLVLQVAHTMTYVHARGIVHRDLKPSNIVVTAQGQAMVLDFGLAHVQDLRRVTRIDTQVGSPAYMAPEQVRGEAIDERVDVYGLTVVLYQLLTTELPFTGDNPEQLKQAILAGAPRPLRAHSRSLPSDLGIVCAVGLDRDRARRYGSIAELANDLEAVLARRPIAARPVSRWLRCVRFAQRNPTWSIAAGAALLLLLQFPLVLWQQQAAANHELSRLNSELEHQRALAEGNYQDAMLTIDQMLVRTGYDDLVTTPGSESLRIELLERAGGLYSHLAARRTGDAALTEAHARVLQYLGSLQQAVGNKPLAEGAWQRALQLLETVEGLDATRLAANVHKLLGQSALGRGDLANAAAFLQQGLCELQEVSAAMPDDHEVRLQVAEIQNSLAITRHDAGDRAGWKALLLTAQASKTAMLAQQPYDLDTVMSFAIGCSNLTRVLGNDDPARAEALLTQAIEHLIALRPIPAKSQVYRLRLANVFDERGSLRQDHGRLAEAEQDHGKALALREELRLEFPDTAEYTNKAASSLHNLARTIQEQKRIAEALPFEVDSITLHRRAVRMAPQQRIYSQHLEYALVTRCAMLLGTKADAELETATDELEAGIVSTEGWLNAARIRIVNAGRVAKADAQRAGELRAKGAADVAAAVDKGCRDLAHFERGGFAKIYQQLEGQPAYDGALAKLRALPR